MGLHEREERLLKFFSRQRHPVTWLSLFGSKNNNYSVLLEVKDSSNNSTLASKPGTFSSKRMTYKGYRYYGFGILFDSPVHMKETIECRIEANVTGPSSGNGVDGCSAVETSDVNFMFANSGQPDGNENLLHVANLLNFCIHCINFYKDNY